MPIDCKSVWLKFRSGAVVPDTLPVRAHGCRVEVVGVLLASAGHLGLSLDLPGAGVVVDFLAGLVAGGDRNGAGGRSRRAEHKPAG